MRLIKLLLPAGVYVMTEEKNAKLGEAITCLIEAFDMGVQIQSEGCFTFTEAENDE